MKLSVVCLSGGAVVPVLDRADASMVQSIELQERTQDVINGTSTMPDTLKAVEDNTRTANTAYTADASGTIQQNLLKSVPPVITF